MAHATGQPILLRKLGLDLFAAEKTQTGLEAALIRMERLVASLLAKPPQARPTLVEAQAELGAATQELGKEPYALHHTYPRTAEHEKVFWKGWADAYQRFNLSDDALPRIQRALDLATDDPRVLISYADVLRGLGRMEDSLRFYRRSLAVRAEADIQGRNISLNQLGNALRHMGRYQEADEAYAEQIELMPDDAVGWYNRANNQRSWSKAEADAGHWDAVREHVTRGLEYAEQAMDLNPDDPDNIAMVANLRSLLDAL
jgi:tetratricopeptide (TPR) repeat protein